MAAITAEALAAPPPPAGAATCDAASAAGFDDACAGRQDDPSLGRYDDASEAGLPAGSASTLRARPFAGAIPAPWIRSSFTALAIAGPSVPHGPDAAGERPDHDQFGDDAVAGDGAAAPRAGAAAGTAAASTSATRAIRSEFPAGAQAGTCLHGILEHTSFAEGVSSQSVGSWLVRCGFGAVDREAVRAWLAEVVAAPLPDLGGGGEVRLDALDPQRTVRELEFVLPARGLDDRALFDAVGSVYPLDVVAAARSWSGMLGGFIDLAYEARGRWYLLDWKSNRLGAGPSGYARGKLEASIGAHGYALQFCLYTLALHRLLRVRLAGYDYDRHFGGVHYVYLRGAGLGDGEGVYSTRPPRALVDTLDRLFEGRR
jgi:exodeoxyribonuclease V beta subunit